MHVLSYGSVPLTMLLVLLHATAAIGHGQASGEGKAIVHDLALTVIQSRPSPPAKR